MAVKRAAAKRTRSRAASDDIDVSDAPVRAELEFGALSTLCGYWVRKAYSKLFTSFNDMLRELDVAPGQYSVLMLIGLNPGTSQMALADSTGIDRSTVVPIVDRFVRLGWVRRGRRRDDRRIYSLRLTPAGKAVLDQAQPIIAQHEALLVQDLTPDERDVLVKLLRKIVESDAFNNIAAAPPKAAAQPNGDKAQSGAD